MDAICPKCGATNRGTSRFCARCGEVLHPGDKTAESQTGGSDGGLDLPWLQTVQDRASKPKTEYLTDAQTIQAPIESASELPQPFQPPEADAPPAKATQPHNAAPDTETFAPQVAQSTPPAPPAPDPNEAPPPWVVSILEPTASQPLGQEHTYEPEELEHIMPWTYGKQATEQSAEQQTQANASGLPPWLSDITVQETLQSTGGQEGRMSLPPDLDIEGIEPFIPPVPEADEGTQSTDTGKQAPPEQVPAWLQSIAPKPGTEANLLQDSVANLSPVVSAATSSFEGPLVRDIPVRPPRAGSVEVLAGLVGNADTPAPRTRQIAQEEVRPRVNAEIASAPRGIASWLLPDGVIYLAILAVLLAVLIVRPRFGDVSAPTASGVQDFYSAIEAVSQRSLPQERTVLVAYDWDATRSAEMSVLAESVTRHLMARHIGFITVSTNPQGPGFAQQITARLRDEYGYVYGREYLVMGYLPGSQAALGALASNFRRNLPVDYEQNRRLDDYPGFTGGSRLQSINNFALVITLASDEAEMRNWVEQVGARTGEPIVAAVPQGLEPLARPYLNIQNAGLKALISGPTGALQYTKQLQTHGITIGKAGSTPLSDRLTAQSAAQLLVAVVIIAALISMLTRKVVRR